MLNNKPFISVLINNYNYASYIEECVNSVLSQTYQNFEIIFVDDGSQDNSYDVISSFQDSRITKIFKENGGQGSAFNAGFEASKGELIAFLDSDDWWKSNKLEEIVDWHNFLKGEYSLLQHNVDVWENGKTYPFKAAMYSGNIFRHSIRSGESKVFVGTSGLTFRREILQKVMPVPNDFRISADAYLTRTSFTFDFVYSIPKSLGYYRKHNNAVLGNSSYDHNKFHTQVLFPHLNRFYNIQNIDFQFRTKSEQCGEPDPASGIYLLKFLIKKKFTEIIKTYPRIAIYGEGNHSKWLSDMLHNHCNESIVAVIETNPIGKKTLFGQIAQEATDWDCSEADAIILSTNSSQESLREKCQKLYGLEVPLIDLYADELKW